MSNRCDIRCHGSGRSASCVRQDSAISSLCSASWRHCGHVLALSQAGHRAHFHICLGGGLLVKFARGIIAEKQSSDTERIDACGQCMDRQSLKFSARWRARAEQRDPERTRLALLVQLELRAETDAAQARADSSRWTRGARQRARTPVSSAGSCGFADTELALTGAGEQSCSRCAKPSPQAQISGSSILKRLTRANEDGGDMIRAGAVAR